MNNKIEMNYQNEFKVCPKLPNKKIFNNFSDKNIKYREEKFINFLNFLRDSKLIPNDDYICKFLEINGNITKI